jgi:branched-chain amino acid aminotransferase
MSYSSSVVFLDGKFVKGEDAKISIWDHALLYGDAVYDTARLYDGQIFKLREHIDRLFDSAKGLAIVPPLDKEELAKIVMDVVKKNAIRNAQIRMILTRGEGPPGLSPSLCKKPSLIVSAVEVPAMLGSGSVRLMISSVRKKSPVSIDSKIKTINYVDSILAKIQSRAANYDDAIMLDPSGYVAEATGANIFYVKNYRLFSPTTVSALAGITRETIIELGQRNWELISKRKS